MRIALAALGILALVGIIYVVGFTDTLKGSDANTRDSVIERVEEVDEEDADIAALKAELREIVSKRSDATSIANAVESALSRQASIDDMIEAIEDLDDDADAGDIARAIGKVKAAAKVTVTDIHNVPAPQNTGPSAAAMTVPVPAANCWTTAEAKGLIGVDVQRIGTEACAWVYRSVGVGSVSMKCPIGAICTVDTGNGIFVDMGPHQRTAVAFTIRKIDSYPAGDGVHNGCDKVVQEQQFGVQENPSFRVQAGNGLNCSGVTTTNTQTMSSNAPAGCPTSPEDAAARVGGNANFWKPLPGNGWKYGPNAPTANLTAPVGRLDWDGGSGKSSPKVAVATLWCAA